MQVNGRVQRYLSWDGYTGKSVLLIKPEEQELIKASKYPNILVYGVCQRFVVGTPVMCHGEYERNANGNIVFKAKDIRLHPWSKETTASYLQAIGSLTKKQSEAVIGIENLANLHNDPNATEKLQQAGLPKDTADTLLTQIKNNALFGDCLNFIVSYGGTWSMAQKVFKKYQGNALELIKKNPYRYGWDAGLSIEACDEIAGAGMLDYDLAGSRTATAIRKAVAAAATSGHVYTDISECIKEVQKLIPETPEQQIRIVMGMSADEGLIYDSTSEEISDKGLRTDEEDVGKHLLRLKSNARKLRIDEDLIRETETKFSIRYAKRQKDAIRLLEQGGVCIVTGGPGTGKTTVLNGLIYAYKKRNPTGTVMLMAPTGRAAQRMTESTRHEATTIHIALGFNPFDGLPYYSVTNPLTADLIVVDEASMLDVELAAMLLKAVPSGATVILVGDIHQLPPVGPGNVLLDIIASNAVPCVKLAMVYRQGEESSIVLNAAKVNQGKSDFITDKDFQVCRKERASQCTAAVKEMFCKYYDKNHPLDTQVLCPTHKGECGVSALNALLQAIVNPKSASKPEIRYGQRIFRLGDKVIFTANNYRLGYYNGDIGILSAMTDTDVTVDIQGKSLHLGGADLGDMLLAYCISIHKSQGSEFKHAIIVMVGPTVMMKRNLLYTAITRAKKTVVLVDCADNSAKAAKNNDAIRRNTHLKEYLNSSANR